MKGVTAVLGQRVRVNAILVRVGLVWDRVPLSEPWEGTVVGKRTLWDSRWDSEGWEYPETRYIDHFWSGFPAYLVAPNLRSFSRVLPEDLELVR